MGTHAHADKARVRSLQTTEVSQIGVLFAEDEGKAARQVKAMAVCTFDRNIKVIVLSYTLQSSLPMLLLAHML